MANFKRASALGLVLSLGVAGYALSQDTPPPPSWPTLVRCAEMGDPDDRLACYDSAMKAAGYAPKPEVVAQARHRVFGLTMPQVNILKHKDKGEEAQAQPGTEAPAQAAAPVAQEDQDHISVVLARVALLGDNRLLFVTSEGAIWEQADTDQVAPLPKEGYEMSIRKGNFGGFFCQATRYKEIRCRRVK